MIRSNLEQFDGSADFVVQIVKCQFNALRITSGAGSVNNDGSIFPLSLGEGGATASGLARRVRVPNAGPSCALTRHVSRWADVPASPKGRGELAFDFVAYCRRLFPVRLVRDDRLAAGMPRDKAK